MRSQLVVAAAILSVHCLLSATAYGITIETVLVGDPGNAFDTLVMNDGTSNYGDVAYEYRIGRYEVTNDQYVAFLRAVADDTDPYELYAEYMNSNVYGGIVRDGVEGNYTYTVKPNMGNKPVMYVSYWDAARFANWMHNGQPTGPQSAATTEDGAYTLNGILTFGGAEIARNPGAGWFIPSDDEWYKAAFYDPRAAASGGPPGDDHYWRYATASDDDPTPATASSVGDIDNPGPNVANYAADANWNGTVGTGNITTVGSAGSLSRSYYGTSDQSGNLVEYNENNAAPGQAHRTIRGGGFGHDPPHWLSAGERTWTGPNNNNYSFRLASVLDPPGPSDPLTGDYNGDGAVDIADYTIWRDTLNQTGSGLAADGNQNNQIDAGDLDVWKANFGRTSGSATSLATVPEPNGLFLVLMSGLAISGLTRRARLR